VRENFKTEHFYTILSLVRIVGLGYSRPFRSYSRAHASNRSVRVLFNSRKSRTFGNTRRCRIMGSFNRYPPEFHADQSNLTRSVNFEMIVSKIYLKCL